MGDNININNEFVDYESTKRTHKYSLGRRNNEINDIIHARNSVNAHNDSNSESKPTYYKRKIQTEKNSYNKIKIPNAKEMFTKAYEVYSIFWGINLNAVDIGEVKKVEEFQLNKEDESKKGTLSKVGDMVKYLINCCKEM